MSLRPYKNKRDASEMAIVDCLRKAGCSVIRVDRPCDLLVGYRGVAHLVEVKTGKRGKLTKAQSDFIQAWRGSPVYIIRDVDGALSTLSLWNAIARRAA